MTEKLTLLAIILLPIMIPIVAISLILGKGSSVSEKIKSIFFLNEDKGLSQQGLLWISILSPILYFIFYSFWVYWLVWSYYIDNKQGY